MQYYREAPIDVAASEIQYVPPQIDPSFGGGAPQRRRVTFAPVSSSTVTLTEFAGGGTRIQFRIPCARGTLMDLRNMTIRADVTITRGLTGATGLAGFFQPAAGMVGSLIEEVRVDHTKSSLYLQNNYNATCAALNTLMSSDAYQTANALDFVDGVSWPISALAGAATAWSGVAVHPLITPFSCTEKLLPTTLTDGALLVTIRTAPGFSSFAAYSSWTNVTAITQIAYTNFNLECDMVEISDPYLSALESHAQEAGGVRVKCSALDTQRQQLSASQQSVQISLSGNHVDQVLFWQSLDLDKTVNAGRPLNPLNKARNALTQYQAYIGDGESQFFPRPQYISAVRAADSITSLAEMLHTLGDMFRGVRLTAAQFVGDGSTAQGTTNQNGPLYVCNLQTVLRNDQAVYLGALVDQIRLDLINTGSAASSLFVCLVKEVIYKFGVGGRIMVE